MPIYEYECSHCRYYLEVIQKISDAKLKKCPSCGKNALKKLISAPVFRLKGSGWYETDFKGDQEQKRNLAGADKEAAGDTKEAKDPTSAIATEGSADTKATATGDAQSDSKRDSKGDSAAEKKPTKADAKTPKAEAARGKQTGRKAPPAKAPPAKPAARSQSTGRRSPVKPKPKAPKRRGRR